MAAAVQSQAGTTTTSRARPLAIDLVELFGGYGVRSAQAFTDADQAVERIEEIYLGGVSRLRDALKRFAEGVEPARSNSFYPFVGMVVQASDLALDGRIAYGVLSRTGRLRHDPDPPGHLPGILSGPARDPDGQPPPAGRGRHRDRPIPLPFAVDQMPENLDEEEARRLQHLFPMPDLSRTDDAIANGTFQRGADRPGALALFTAERVDYSLARFLHYTGTAPGWVQRFILLTNYQRYVDHFINWGRRQILEGEEYDFLVEPGNVTTPNPRMTGAQPGGHAPGHLPQMPAYHLTRPGGVASRWSTSALAPSNARTITDHLAVLRPHCWLMLGHCAGLRRSSSWATMCWPMAMSATTTSWTVKCRRSCQFLRSRKSRSPCNRRSQQRHRPGWPGPQKTPCAPVPSPAPTTATGNFATTSSSNDSSQSRTIAVDMESATIATNGFRFRVPYGTLLCVSDKPLHGELKLRGSPIPSIASASSSIS